MPGMVMVPKTSNPNRVMAVRNTTPFQQTQRQSSATSSSKQSNNSYSLSQESFDSILAMDSPFFKKVNSVTNSVKQVEDDGFDPFHIGEAAATTTNVAMTPTKPSTTSSTIAAADALSTLSNESPALLIAPKVLVKFKVHEEIASIASISRDDGTATTSQVYVEGTIQAQVVSSDALKNAPFVLRKTKITNPAAAADGSNNTDDDNTKETLEFIGNEKYTKDFQSAKNNSGNQKMDHVVKIPKDIVSFVNVGSYTSSCRVDHMPLLLEQKVVRSKSKVQIAIQVRSKLTNPDDLSNFTIVVSVPPRVNSNSIAIVNGSSGEKKKNGVWDRYKRTITWEVDRLPKGQSFMVSAKCALDDIAESPEAAQSNDGINFPVLLRCSSNDQQISPFRFEAAEASGYPAIVSSSTVSKSFCIIHRLQ